MGLFDDDTPRKPETTAVAVGDDLSRLSENELAERIDALENEINRTRAELEQRSTIRDDANSIFRK